MSDICFKAKGHGPTVPEPVAGVRAPTLASINRIINRALFIDHSGDGLPHPLGAALAEVLGHADHLDAGFGQSMDRVNEQAHVTSKARLTVDEDDLDWSVGPGSISNHAVELWPLTERATQPAVDILTDNVDPVALSILVSSVTLSLNRKRLSAFVIDGQAQIQIGFLCRLARCGLCAHHSSPVNSAAISSPSASATI
nr:hypothetical protein [Erythrobacter donghaensis]